MDNIFMNETLKVLILVVDLDVVISINLKN